jgi:predicted phosphodiesterase
MTKSIAVLADIHANIWALDAVLSDIHRRGADVLLNLGDVLHGALEPRATFERLQREDVLLTVRGNQDREIDDANEQDRRNNPKLDFVINNLGADALEWLRNIPETAVFEDEVFLCHGTPSSDATYLLEDVSSGHPLPKAEDEIIQLLGDVRHPVVLCGHTHIPRLVRLQSGQIILNPGSVGLPAYSEDQPVPHAMENYSPHASYAIVTKTNDGWDGAFHKVAYDHQKAAQVAASRGRKDWAASIATGRIVARTHGLPPRDFSRGLSQPSVETILDAAD